ncbi:MAG: hypothetical protein ABI832_06790, partial [bacterium]
MRTLSLTVAIALLAAPAWAEDLTFSLVNNSSVNLIELYVAPHASDDWGDNILTVDALNSGESGTVTIADGEATCDYDLQFSMDNGAVVEGRQNLCDLDTYTLHD